MWKLMRRLVLVSGVAACAAALMEWRRAHLAGDVPFDQVRRAMNGRLNPWLMERGLVGGAHSEIALLEHVGRRTGRRHLTPVHPTFVDEQVWIPLPYGSGSQWARNVIAAGHCRMTMRGEEFELDEPQIVPALEDPKLPERAARLAGWLGVEYLRLHTFAERSIAATGDAMQTPGATEATEPAAVGRPDSGGIQAMQVDEAARVLV